MSFKEGDPVRLEGDTMKYKFEYLAMPYACLRSVPEGRKKTVLIDEVMAAEPEPIVLSDEDYSLFLGGVVENAKQMWTKTTTLKLTGPQQEYLTRHLDAFFHALRPKAKTKKRKR